MIKVSSDEKRYSSNNIYFFFMKDYSKLVTIKVFGKNV